MRASSMSPRCHVAAPPTPDFTAFASGLRLCSTVMEGCSPRNVSRTVVGSGRVAEAAEDLGLSLPPSCIYAWFVYFVSCVDVFLVLFSLMLLGVERPTRLAMLYGTHEYCCSDFKALFVGAARCLPQHQDSGSAPAAVVMCRL